MSAHPGLASILAALAIGAAAGASPPVWLDRFDGPAGENDVGYAALVTGGALYVAGIAYEEEAGLIVPRGYVARHHLDTGVRAWQLLYGAAEGAGIAYSCAALAAAPDDGVYVGCARFDAFALLHVSSAGTVVWARQRPSDGTAFSFGGLATDGAGNAYLAGRSFDALGNTVAAVAEYSPAGALLATWSYGGPAGTSVPAAIAVDGEGSIYLAGATAIEGAADEASLVKLDAAGNLAWERFFGAPGPSSFDRFTAVAADPARNRVIGVGVVNQQAAGGTDGLAVGIGFDGAVAFDSRVEGIVPGNDGLLAVAVASDGSFYAAGHGEEGLSGADPLVARFAADGALAWTRSFAGSGDRDDSFYALALTPDGGVAAAGQQALGVSSNQYLYARFAAAGVELDRAAYAGPLAASRAWALALDAAGNAYVSGGSFASGAGQDIATLRYDAVNAGPGLLVDGFESGDTSRWSLTEP